MNFLLEEEEQATLAEALAFIDTFPFDDDDSTEESDASSSSSSHSPLYVELRFPPSHPTKTFTSAYSASHASPMSTVSSSSCGPASSSADSSGSGSDDVVDDEQKRLLKTRAANTRAVNRYRKRNKTEILELREQVVQLNVHLAQLRKRGEVSTDIARSSSRPALLASYARGKPSDRMLPQLKGSGFDLAVIEYKKLQESESLNRKLKEALAKQRGVNSSLSGLFQRQVSKNDLSFVLDVEKLLQKKSTETVMEQMSYDNGRIYSELFNYLKEVVYGSTPSVVAQLKRGDPDCVYNNTLIKHDVKHGKMLEFMSNAPIECSMECLDELLWNHLRHPNDAADIAKSPVQTPEKRSCDRQFTMNFSGTLSGVAMDGMSAVHRFVEPNRIVLTYTSLLVPRASGLLFRENGWLILSNAQAAGCTVAPTVFQTFYRLYVERQDTNNAGGMAIATANLIDLFLNAQSDKMRNYQLMIQNMLLHQRDAIPSGSILGACSAVECGA